MTEKKTKLDKFSRAVGSWLLLDVVVDEELSDVVENLEAESEIDSVGLNKFKDWNVFLFNISLLLFYDITAKIYSTF